MNSLPQNTLILWTRTAVRPTPADACLPILSMRLYKFMPWLLCLLLTVAVGLFYGLLYPYHLHYYEQMQMFQF